MKTILLWDLRVPDARPRRLSVVDPVAFALVRAGVAAAADPADAGALAVGALALDPIAATSSVEIALAHGSGTMITRVFVPVGAAAIAIGAGVGAAVGAPVAGSGGGASGTRWSIAGTGPEIGGLLAALSTRASGLQFAVTRTLIATGPVVGTKLRLLYSNNYFPLGIKAPNPNAVNFEGGDVVVGGVFDPSTRTWSGGTAYPIRFGGAPTYSFAPGEELFPDDIEAPFLPNSIIQVRAAVNVAAGDRLPGHRFTFDALAGEGVNDGGTSQLGRIATPAGTITPGSGNLGGGGFAPVGAFFNADTGGVIAFADSRFKTGFLASAFAGSRGATGFIELGYDSLTNGRRPVWMIGSPGSALTSMRNGGNPGRPCLPWIADVCAMLGNRPFDNADIHLGTNDLAGGAIEANFETLYGQFSTQLRAIEAARPMRMFVGTMGPTTSADPTNAPGNFASTEAGQTSWVRATQGPDPSVRSIVNARIVAGGFAAQGVDGFTDVAKAAEGVTPAKIRSAGFSTTIVNDVAAGSKSVVLADASPLGDVLLFDNLDANNFDVHSAYAVTSVTGSAGAYTHVIDRALAKPHAAGSPVRGTLAFDSLHYQTRVHLDQAAILAAKKTMLL